MFYIRNTRGAILPFLIEMTNTGGEVSVDHSRKKRSYYLRNTRAGHSFYKAVPGKKLYYLRNTRGPIEVPEHYVRNGRDWFMRNTRSGLRYRKPSSNSELTMGKRPFDPNGYPRRDSIEKRPFNPSRYGKRDFYIRNTRAQDKRSPITRQWYVRNTRGEAIENPESILVQEEDDPLEEDKYIRNTRVPKPSLWEMTDTKQGQNLTFSCTCYFVVLI